MNFVPVRIKLSPLNAFKLWLLFGYNQNISEDAILESFESRNKKELEREKWQVLSIIYLHQGTFAAHLLQDRLRK